MNEHDDNNFMDTTEVYDEAELGEIFERAEREACIAKTRGLVRQDAFNESELINGLECDECGEVITLEEQRAVLQIISSCNVCVSCRRDAEDEKKRKQRLREINGSGSNYDA